LKIIRKERIIHMANDNTNEQSKSLDSIFSPILEEFGTNAPQLSVVVAVIIGSLGFDSYFNAGAWTIVSILCFGLIYLFKRQIGSNIVKTGRAVSVIFIILIIPLAYFIYKDGFTNVLAFMKDNIILTTAYTAVLVTIPLAILISCYRKQEASFGLRYPDRINSAIENQLLKSKFFKSNVIYTIKFEEIINPYLYVVSTLSYDVTNRTSEAQVWKAVLRSEDPNPEILCFEVDNENIFIKDPKYKIHGGLEYSKEIAPKQTSQFKFSDRSRFYVNDNELYTTYDPAEDFTLVLVNKFNNMVPSFEILYDRYGKPIHSKRDGNTYTVKINYGLLPYQGIRLNWTKKEEINNGEKKR
jgi:hypothetical protein